MIKSVIAFAQGRWHFGASAEKLIFPCYKGAITDGGGEEPVPALWSSISTLAALGRAAAMDA